MADNSIALQATIPSIQDQLAPISGMIDLQQKSAQWRARQRLGQVLNDPANRDENGDIDLTKMMSAALAADPGNYYATDTIRGIADSRTANMNAMKARQDVMANARQYMSTLAGSLTDRKNNDPSFDQTQGFYEGVLDGRKTGAIDPAMAGLFLRKTAPSPSASSPPEVIQAHSANMSDKLQKMAALNKKPVNPLNNFSSYNPSNVNPNVSQPSASAQSAPVNQQVSDADLRQTTMMGATPTQQNDVTRVDTGTQSVPTPASRLSIGYTGQPITKQPGAVAAQVDSSQGAATEFTRATRDAISAPAIEGIASNVRQFAIKAIIGKGSGALAALQGYLNTISGGTIGDITKTQTDELAKQIAQLTDNSPQATDLARMIHQAATPGMEMNLPAIRDTAAQIAGQARSKAAYQRALQPAMGEVYRNNLTPFQNAQKNFADHGDPRAFQWDYLRQFPASDPNNPNIKNEADKMFAGMDKQDAAALRKHIQALHGKGLIQ